MDLIRLHSLIGVRGCETSFSLKLILSRYHGIWRQRNIYNTLEFIGLSSINFCSKFYTKHVKYRDTICHTLKFFCLPAFHVRYQKPLPKTIIFKASQVICRSSTRILSRSVANHKGKQKKKMINLSVEWLKRPSWRSLSSSSTSKV